MPPQDQSAVSFEFSSAITSLVHYVQGQGQEQQVNVMHQLVNEQGQEHHVNVIP
jgi:hypothetical protein